MSVHPYLADHLHTVEFNRNGLVFKIIGKCETLAVPADTTCQRTLCCSDTIAVLISTIDRPVMRQIHRIPARIVVHTVRLNGSIVNVVLIDQFEFPVISKFHFTLTAFCFLSCFLNGCCDICRFCFHRSRKNPDSTENHGNTQG